MPGIIRKSVSVELEFTVAVTDEGVTECLSVDSKVIDSHTVKFDGKFTREDAIKEAENKFTKEHITQFIHELVK